MERWVSWMGFKKENLGQGLANSRTSLNPGFKRFSKCCGLHVIGMAEVSWYSWKFNLNVWYRQYHWWKQIQASACPIYPWCLGIFFLSNLMPASLLYALICTQKEICVSAWSLASLDVNWPNIYWRENQKEPFCWGLETHQLKKDKGQKFRVVSLLP